MIDNTFFQNRPISHSIYPNHPEYQPIDPYPSLLHHPLSYDQSSILIKHSSRQRRLAPQTLTKSYQFELQELSPTKNEINQNNESMKNNQSFCPTLQKKDFQPLRVNFKYSQCLTCGNPIQYHSHIISNRRESSAPSVYREQLMRPNINRQNSSDEAFSHDHQSENKSEEYPSSQQNVALIEQLQNSCIQLNRKVQALQEELKEREQKVECLQRQIETKIETIVEKEHLIEEIFSSVKNLQKRCEDEKTEKQQLLEEKFENLRKNEQMERYAQEKLAQKEQLIKKQQEQINTYRSQLTMMVQKQQQKYNSDKYYQCKKEKNQLMDDLDKRDKKIVKQQKNLQQLTSQLAVLKEDNRKNHEVNTKLQNLYNQKKKQLQDIENRKQPSQINIDPQMINEHYEKQISELNLIIQEKNKQIDNLKASVKRLQAKIEQIQDNYMSHNQLTTLHKQINDCQNKILADGGAIFDKLNNTTHSYFNGKVFEDLLIYELKKDNMRLLKKLGKTQGGNIEMNDRINFKRLESYQKTGSMPTKIGMQAIHKIQTLVQDISSKINRLLMMQAMPKVQQSSSSKKKSSKKEALLYSNLQNELKICGMGLNQLLEYLQALIQTNPQINNSQTNRSRTSRGDGNFQTKQTYFNLM